MPSLNTSDKEEFLQLQRELILFTNQKLGIYPKFKAQTDLIEPSQEDLKNGLMPIREKMYASKNIDDFCEHVILTPSQKKHVISWKNVYSGDFFIVKYLKDYAVLLDAKSEKLYGVIGIHNGFDFFFPNQYLPMLVQLKLLSFNDLIVFDGFFASHNIHFGSNYRQSINEQYRSINNLHGIISSPVLNTPLSQLTASKSDAELIKIYIKQAAKEHFFPSKAWNLAKEHVENRLVFEKEYTKRYMKYQTSSLKDYDEIKPMHYAMYRDCVVGVAENKKALLTFCDQHYPDITQYLTIFKS